jgi:hypothetical protein
MFKPLFAEAICSQPNLITAAIKAQQSAGGCCKPDTSGKGCLPLSRSEFDTCCRNSCALINQHYGCTLDCNNGECDHMGNPFPQTRGSGVDGKAMFESCRRQYCPGSCTAKDFLGAENQILSCCNNQCRMDAGCKYDCSDMAQKYRKNWGGDDKNGNGGINDKKIKEIRQKFIELAIKGGIPSNIAPQVADCTLNILIPKFGIDKFLDDTEPTQEESDFIDNTVKDCYNKVTRQPIKPIHPTKPDRKELRQKLIELAIKGGISSNIAPQVVDCTLNILIPKFGIDKLLDDTSEFTQEESDFIDNTAKDCYNKVIQQPTKKSPTDKSWFDKHKNWFYIVGGLLILIVIVVVILFEMKGKNKKRK